MNQSENTKEALIVLCRPEESRNVGSVCRAMKNMDIHNLRIVGKKEDYDEEKSLSFQFMPLIYGRMPAFSAQSQKPAPTAHGFAAQPDGAAKTAKTGCYCRKNLQSVTRIFLKERSRLFSAMSAPVLQTKSSLTATQVLLLRQTAETVH